MRQFMLLPAVEVLLGREIDMEGKGLMDSGVKKLLRKVMVLMRR